MRAPAVILALFLFGCTHRVSIIFPNVVPAERHKTWVNGWLWDLIGGETSAAHFCGDRPVSRIQTAKSFGNHLVSWLTLGIYTPMHATITCGVPAAPPTPGFGGYLPAPPVPVYPPVQYAPAQPPVYPQQ